MVRRGLSLNEYSADCSPIVLVGRHVHAFGRWRDKEDGKDDAWGQDAGAKKDSTEDHSHLLFSGEGFEPVTYRGGFLKALGLLAEVLGPVHCRPLPFRREGFLSL